MINIIATAELASKGKMQMWAGLTAFIVLITLVGLIRKSKLKTSYSLLWFVGWFLCSVFIAFPNLLDSLTFVFGISYSPTLLLLLMILTLGLIVLHVTTVITRQSKQINALTQELALLKEKSSCED